MRKDFSRCKKGWGTRGEGVGVEWHHGPTIQELVDLERGSPFPRAVFFSSVKWERTAPLS